MAVNFLVELIFFEFLGELLNISDAYSHPLFYRKLDEATGFKTRYLYL